MHRSQSRIAIGQYKKINHPKQNGNHRSANESRASTYTPYVVASLHCMLLCLTLWWLMLAISHKCIQHHTSLRVILTTNRAFHALLRALTSVDQQNKLMKQPPKNKKDSTLILIRFLLSRSSRDDQRCDFMTHGLSWCQSWCAAAAEHNELMTRCAISRFAEGKSDKEILDHLLTAARYDKRLLPPVDGKCRSAYFLRAFRYVFFSSVCDLFSNRCP